ncbi:hypothetical protein QWZ17_17645 [Mucilaginibacter flavus]|nr:hypothetical protein [Mucilaginibacter flavus]
MPYNYGPAVIMVMTNYHCSSYRMTIVMAMNRRANPGFYYYLCFGSFKSEQSNNGDH